jgi:WD40 repeat protein/energy-coupling factor transporter ATP-binding protein EcfA2
MTTYTTTAAPPDGRAARFNSLPAMKAAYNELSKLRRGGGGEEFFVKVKEFIGRARATGAILNLESERWDGQTLVDYWVNFLCREGVALDERETALAPFDPAQAPTLDDSQRPYVGLDAFNEQMKDLFFGRQQLVEKMSQKIADGRWLAVLGESGSGKSSLVQAGLLPRLRAGAVPGSEAWHYFPRAVPGADPLINLAWLVAPEGARASDWAREQARLIAQDAGHLLRLINEATGDAPAFILVDQFEEIFTLTSDGSVRQSFIESLLRVVGYEGARHTVVVTMRSDVESYVTKNERLKSLFDAGGVRVRALDVAELREAIEKPAERIGLKFEEGIVDELIKQVLGEPGGLPLLQFTLLKLWDKRRQNLVTWEAFQQLGSCHEALRRSADRVYNDLNAADRVRAKRIFMRLVRPSGEVETFSNRVPREALYLKDEARAHTDRVLGRFIAEGLLRETDADVPGESKIEVAHEALIRHWETLVAWLNEERATVRSRLRLAEVAKQWDASGRDPDLLLRGAALAEALKLEDLNPLEQEFVERSQRRQRLWKGVVWAVPVVVAIALVVFLAALIFVYWRGKNRAEEAENVASSRRLAALSSVYKNDRVDESLLLSLHALAVKDTFEARSSLMDALGQNPQLVSYLRGQKSPSLSLAFEEGDNNLVSVAEDGSFNTWNTQTHRPVSQTGPRFEDARGVRFSPDRSLAAVYTSDRRLLLADASGGQEIRQFELEPEEDLYFPDFSFSPDGKTLVGDYLNQVVVWDVGTGKVRGRFDLNKEIKEIIETVNCFAFSPDSRTLAVGTDEGWVWLWDVTTGKRVAHFQLAGDSSSEIDSLAFWPPDGKILAIGTYSGVFIGDWRGGVKNNKLSEMDKLDVPVGGVNALAFSPDGKLLASANSDKSLSVWKRSVFTSERVGFDDLYIGVDKLIGHTAKVTALSFSQDGKLLASADGDGNVLLWAAEKRWPLAMEILPPGAEAAPRPSNSRESSSTATSETPARDKLDLHSTMAVSHDGKTLAVIAEGEDAWSVILLDVGSRQWVGGPLKIPAQSERAAPEQGRSNKAASPAQYEPDWIAYSPDSQTIAVNNGRSSAGLLDVTTGQFRQLPLDDIPGLKKLTNLTFSPDGNILAVAASTGENGLLYRWDVKAARPLPTFQLPDGIKGNIKKISFRPDGKVLAAIVGSQPAAIENQSQPKVKADDVVVLLDPSDGRKLSLLTSSQAPKRTYSRNSNTSKQASGITWGMDNKLLAVGWGNTVEFWEVTDPASCKQLGRFQTQRVAYASDLIFCRGGDTLAVSGIGQGIELWDVQTRRPQGTLSGLGSRVSIAASPGGDDLFSLSFETLLLWDLRLNSWKEQACAVANRNLTDDEKDQFSIPKGGQAPCKFE